MGQGRGFSRFPGSPTEKENRTGIGRTLPFHRAFGKQPHYGKDPMTTATTIPNITSFPTPNKQLEDTLRSVIQSLIDGQEGFRQIGEKLDDATLKSYFMGESLKRASFRGELETALHMGGVADVKETGTATGAMQRTWADIKSKLGGGDHTLLETAEAGEDAAKKAYKDAMEKDLPLPIRELLVMQYAHVQASHDYVKAARDARK
jgi:uncharacterized protein (TIGR02284 family)